MCFAPQRRALFWHFFDIWTSKSGPRPSVFNTFDLEILLRATTACTFSTSQLPKVVRSWKCFVHFDLEMCFAPQRRALFQHCNFQKWSEPLVFCAFWLRNVLRATTACTFSTSQLPKVVRSWGVLYILTWKMCFAATTACNFSSLIWPAGSAPAALASLLFRPSGATNHWKNTVFRDFPTFSRICIFFLLIFSLLTLLTSAFQLSYLSEVSLSKLPSTKYKI